MTDASLAKLPIAISRLLLAVVSVALTTPTSPGQTATPPSPQSASTSIPYQPTMKFDVASVRENKEFDRRGSVMMSGRFLPNTTTLRVLNWGIKSLIGYAFGVHEYQIAGAPDWPWPTVFVIQAKGDSDADARMAALTKAQQEAEQQHMLQSLLEDRFRLKTHWETKEGDAYNLVVAKGGPRLSTAVSIAPSTNESTNESANESKPPKEHPEPKLYQKNDGAGFDFIAHDCPLNLLIDSLVAQFSRPVIDTTGLTGRYDFVLRYKGRWDRDRSVDDLDPMPPLDRALQDQLGLKLEPVKAPIRILVIDQIQKPSEN